jgi:CRISPR-associated protein Cas2
MYVIVCYDISDNRRRLRLHKLLLAYGTPVQRSVFECNITPQQLGRLRQQAGRLARGRRDSIRYYQMCRQCQEAVTGTGVSLVEAPPPGKDFII